METKLAESSSETIRDKMRERYGATARGESASCGDECCTSTKADALGYSAEESAIAPEAANLGLGCGNPLAIASLRPRHSLTKSEQIGPLIQDAWLARRRSVRSRICCETQASIRSRSRRRIHRELLSANGFRGNGSKTI